MPHSPTHRSAALRASFTGEHYSVARAGLCRDGSMGLDDCTPAQGELRALLAFGWFNTGSLAAPLGWDISRTLIYSTTPSPRQDQLVITVNACDNVAEQLAGYGGVPGLRAEYDIGFHTTVLRHLPTGAGLEVTQRDRPRRPVRIPVPPPRDNFLPTMSHPLTDREEKLLAQVPPMTADARTLLGGIAVRVALRDPDGQWSVGRWFGELQQLLPRPVHRSRYNVTRRLWGAYDRWDLEWTSYPPPEDLVGALTHPRCGISGLSASKSNASTWLVRLGTAQLQLHDRDPLPETSPR